MPDVKVSRWSLGVCRFKAEWRDTEGYLSRLEVFKVGGGSLKGGLQTVSGEAKWMEVEKIVVTKENTLNSLHKCV